MKKFKATVTKTQQMEEIKKNACISSIKRQSEN